MKEYEVTESKASIKLPAKDLMDYYYDYDSRTGAGTKGLAEQLQDMLGKNVICSLSGKPINEIDSEITLHIEKKQIAFINKQHESFYNDKLKEMQELGKTDVYYRAIVYTLGICETTREHFEDIFNLKRGEINIDSIQGAYQTGTSEKVTRMAFSLWNKCNYDSEQDLEAGNISTSYNASEIFSCSYAPYFYEAIKIRYPEYTREIEAEY